MSKKEEKMNSLQNEFNRIQEENKDLDVSKYLAKREDLPDLGEIQIYDYDADTVESQEQAIDILESLVDMYLGDNPSILKHKYIQKKMMEDAQVYADTIFLQKMTKKNFLTQLRQVDNGDSSARMHEVINQSISQIRDNIKFSQNQRTDLEKFYRDMRKDLGLNEISESMEQKNMQDHDINNNNTNKEEGKIMDTRSLNNMIDNYLKNKE
jgi:hypothetical protein